MLGHPTQNRTLKDVPLSRSLEIEWNESNIRGLGEAALPELGLRPNQARHMVSYKYLHISGVLGLPPREGFQARAEYHVLSRPTRCSLGKAILDKSAPQYEQ